MNEREFMETMSALVTAAAANENRVTEEEVRSAFSQMELSEEQFEMIRKYLKGNRVTVIGTKAQETEEIREASEGVGEIENAESRGSNAGKQEALGESPEEAAIFAEYERQIEAMKRLTEEELKEVAAMLLETEGRDRARNRLAEHFLPMTIRFAREYGGRGVTRNDLAQEGSLKLLEAMEQYKEGELEAFLEGELRKAMELLIGEQEGQSAIGEKLSSRANRLMDVSEELSKELGREPTAAELAGKLGLSEEEVKDVMKISLDAISVLEAQGGPAPEDLSSEQDF